MIEIHPSPTADTRTCDYKTVTVETLLASSKQHIIDVRRGLHLFVRRLETASNAHDIDKITDIASFHADFIAGFTEGHTSWWERHRKRNRHHLNHPDGVPVDVDLVDVLDYITDCVMAGMARSGDVYDLEMSPELLDRAFRNTVALLKNRVRVVPVPTVEVGPPSTLQKIRAAFDDLLVAEVKRYDGVPSLSPEEHEARMRLAELLEQA